MTYGDIKSEQSLNVLSDPRLNVSQKSIDEVYNSSKVLESYMSKASDAVKQLLESKASLAEYQKLFKSYFLKSFSSRLVDYTNPRINVVSQKKINEKYTIVNSVLEATSKRPQVKIDWRIYTKNPERPLIRDLIVEGLSLARTQKEEFNSIIQNNDGDINALFKTLEEFLIK